MLPFTKRPGRGDEAEDNDVVTKDDVGSEVSPSATGSRPVPAVSPVRVKFSSLSDDEMTNVLPSKSISEALESARAASPRPAAGMPPSPSPGSGRTGQRTVPPSRVSTSASRSGKFVSIEPEDDDVRTKLRGAPKIVKRTSSPPNSRMGMSTVPTTISPAAVIKATLESARAGQNLKRTGDHLMAPPPKDLLEDLSDLEQIVKNDPPSGHTKVLPSPASVPPPLPSGLSRGSTSAPPPPMSSNAYPMQSGGHTMQSNGPPALHSSGSGGYASLQSGGHPAAHQSGGYASLQSGGHPAAHQSGGYASLQSGGYPAHQSGGYAAQYTGPGSVSAPGVSMPAHFMVPQAPNSDGRLDPPGTSITSRTSITGRPAMSWAMALMAFGLFVGVGAFAVMRGNADGFMETSASFVDPARAAAGSPKAVAAAAHAPAPNEQPAAVIVAPIVTPPAAVVVAPPPAVTVAAPATPPAPVVAPPAPVVVTPPPPVVVAAPAARPAPHPPARPFVRPAPPPVEEPVAAAPTPPKPAAGRVKPAPGAKPTGDPSVDEEQKKALKALQESQLESTF